MNIKDKFRILKGAFPTDRSLKFISIDDKPPGYFSDGDIKQYRELFNMIPEGGKVIEIGCFFGRSLCSVADIIIKKKLKVFAIDLFNSPQWGNVISKLDLDSHYDEFIDILKSFNIHKNVCAFRMSSLDAHVFFDDEDFDLIFLDSSHEYAHVIKEIQLYKSKIKQTGLLCGHDLNDPGVEKAVKEAFESYKKLDNSVIWVKTGNYKI